MSLQSLCAKAGLRTATLGSAASLALAFPLSEGSMDPAAHTAASRTGFYAVAGTQIDHVVNGVDIISVTQNALAISPGTTTNPTVLNIFGVINNYFEVNVNNDSATSAASSDVTVTADNGTTSTHYANFGINSSAGGGLPFAGINAAYLYNADQELNIGAGMVAGATPQINFWIGTTPTRMLQILTATSTFANELVTAASTTTTAGFNLPHGAAPTAPVNGDVWTTTAGMFARINGVTSGPFGAGGTIGGSIANTQIAVGSGSNTIAGSSALTLVPGTVGVNYTQAVQTSGSPSLATWTGAAHTTLAANAEAIDINYNLNRTVQFTAGTIATQRAVAIQSPTYAFTAAGTVTDASSLSISGPPTGGTNATLTTSSGLHITTRVVANTASARAITLDAPTGGTANFSQVNTGGKALFATAVAGYASVNLPHGAAPTTPVNGDVWTTTTAMFVYINGATVQLGSGTGTIGGSIAANQVAVGNGVNTIAGSASWTSTTTSGALINALASGTSTATTSTISDSNSITFSGIFTTGPVAAFSSTATFTGATATAAVQLASGSFLTTSTGAVTNSAGVFACANALTVTPTGATSTTYIGEGQAATVSSAANVFFAGSTLIGSTVTSTFNTANTTGAAVATAIVGEKVTLSIQTTNASSTNTIANVYGIWVAPNTWVSSGGGGLTITNYYGLLVDTITLTTMTVTNKYGVYQNDAAASNFFAGKTGVGTAALTTTYLATPISTTTTSSLNIPHGAAPTAPVNGDIWTTTTAMFVRINGATVQLGSGTGTIGGSIAANQVAVGSGVNTIAGSASWTSTTTASALLNALASGTSTAVASTTFSDLTGTSTGALNASAIVLGTSSAITANPGSAIGASSYYGAMSASTTVTSSTSAFVATGTGIYGGLFTTTFNGAQISGTALVNLVVVNATPNVVMTSASGGATITNVYGVNVAPGTFSTSVGGTTTTISNYYGIYLGTVTTSGSGTTTLTNRYGVYQNDAAAKNFFAGVSGLGVAPIASTWVNTPASTTTVSSLRVAHGAAPTTPVNGDIWTTTTAMFVYINGATQQLGVGTIGGSIAANQVAVGSGVNTVAGSASWTSTTTSGALINTLASGTSTATTTTAASGTSVSYSGVFTTGPVSAVSASNTITGATASAVVLTGLYSTMTSTGAITSSSGVSALYGTTSITPSGATTTNYFGIQANSTVNGAANVFFAGSTLFGASIGATFNTSNTTGAAVAAAVIGSKVFVSVQSTNASGTNTIASVYGMWIAPGTFTSTGGGGLTITNYYGLFVDTLTLTTMTVTNRYGVYQADVAAQNFFGGVTGLGVAASATTWANHPAGTTGVSSMRIAHGVAPTAPVNGDIWTTTAGFFVQINGVTQQMGTGSGTVTGTGTLNQVAMWNGTSALTGTTAFFFETDGSNYNRITLSYTSLTNTLFAVSNSTSGIKGIAFLTASNYRWQVMADGSEAGGNSGSSLCINSYNDAGVIIAQILKITRNSNTATWTTVKHILPAATTTQAPLNIPAGVAPTTPTDGDIWTTTTAMFVRINGVTQQLSSSTGTIGGSIAANQIAFGSGANTIAGDASFTATLTTGAYVFAHTPTSTSTASQNLHSIIGGFTGTAAGSTTQNLFDAESTVNPGGTVGASSIYSAINALMTAAGGATTRLGTATNGGITAVATHTIAATAGTTLTTLYGVRANASINASQASGSNATTNVYGVWVDNTGWNVTTGATTTTVTNYYGIYIGTITATGSGTLTITNRYGVYQADATALNFFAGNTSVGGATASASTALSTPAGTTAESSMRLPHGAAPTAPVNGDVWTTTTAMFVRINGATVQLGSGGGTIGGSIAANQVAIGSGVNTIAGSASWTATTTASALLQSHSAGTSTATGATDAHYITITYSGAATAGPLNGLNVLTNSTGAIASASVYTQGIASTLTVAPTGLCAADFFVGSASTVTVTAAANAYLATSSIIGSTINSTFSTANTSGTTVVASVVGLKVIPNVGSTNASGLNTVPSVYGMWVAPTLFNSALLNGLTVTNYYGLYLDTVTLSYTALTNRYGVYQADTLAINYFAGAFSAPASVLAATTASTLVTVSGTYSGNSSGSMYGLSSNITSTGAVSTAGVYHAGIQTAITATPSNTVAAITYTGAYVTATLTSAVNAYAASASLIGSVIYATFATANTATSNAMAAVVGQKIVPGLASTNASGVNTVPNVYGVWVAPTLFNSSSSGGLVITNYYGLYLDNVTVSYTTVTNRYGVYQADTSAQNFFGGVTGLGVAASTTTWANYPAGTTGVSSLRVAHGVAPTAPVNGDIWTTTTAMFVRINGATVQLGAAGLAGTCSANQVIVGSGVNTATGSSIWTATTTSGALLVALQSGTSTATTATSANLTATTFSGIVTSGVVSSVTANTIGTGAIAAGNIYVAGGYFTSVVNAGSATAGNYVGTLSSASSIASASILYASTSIIGSLVQATFNGAQTSSAALYQLMGVQVAPSVVMTQTSGSTNISAVYGITVNPGTFLTASGGTTVISAYYGLYLGAVTVSGSGTTTLSTNYGIYQVDANATNSFAGLITQSWSASSGSYNALSSTATFAGTASAAAVNLAANFNGSTNTGQGLTLTTTTASANSGSNIWGMYLSYSYNGTGATPIGLYSAMAVNPNGAAGTTYVGIQSSISNVTANNTFLSSATLASVSASTTFSSASTAGGLVVSNVYGLACTSVSVAMNQSSGADTITGSVSGLYFGGFAFSCATGATSITITNVYGAQIGDAVNANGLGNITGTGTTTITNLYGIYIGTITGGTITNRYGIFQADSNALNSFAGQISVVTAGKGFTIKEGSNAKMGLSVAMTAGSVTISTTAVTANSRIFLSNNVNGGTAGFLRVSAITAGVSFVITSSSGTDTSRVAWMIVEAS